MGCADPKKPRPAPPSQQELELARQAEEAWSYYRENYIPLEDAQIQEVKDLRGATERDDLVARSVAATRDQLPGMSAPVGSTGGGDARARALGLETIHGSAVGGASAEALQQNEERYQSGIQRIIDYGLGKNARAIQTTARSAINDAARVGADTAARNYARDQSWQRRMDTLGSAAGGGVAAGMAFYDRWKSRPRGSAPSYGSPGATTTFDPNLAGIPQSRALGGP